MQRILTAAAIIGAVTLATAGLTQAQTGATPTYTPPATGTPGMTTPPATGEPSMTGSPSAADVRQAQERLHAQGFYNGPSDGRLSPETKAALSAFQRSKGLPQTANLDSTTLGHLMGGAATPGSSGSSMPPSAPSKSPASPELNPSIPSGQGTPTPRR